MTEHILPLPITKTILLFHYNYYSYIKRDILYIFFETLEYFLNILEPALNRLILSTIRMKKTQ